MISSDYPMTFGYGRTDPPYGTPQWPYHRGDDYYMPVGTPIIVNGVQIGISGASGFVTGAHCHVGKFVNGKDVDPKSQAWTIPSPVVTEIGFDSTNGHFVALQDKTGTRWVYLHMDVPSTFVKVGDHLDDLPKYVKEDSMDRETLNYIYRLSADEEPDQATIDYWLGRPAGEFAKSRYDNNEPFRYRAKHYDQDLANLQKRVADLESQLADNKAASKLQAIKDALK